MSDDRFVFAGVNRAKCIPHRRRTQLTGWGEGRVGQGCGGLCVCICYWCEGKPVGSSLSCRSGQVWKVFTLSSMDLGLELLTSRMMAGNLYGEWTCHFKECFLFDCSYFNLSQRIGFLSPLCVWVASTRKKWSTRSAVSLRWISKVSTWKKQRINRI